MEDAAEVKHSRKLSTTTTTTRDPQVAENATNYRLLQTAPQSR